MAIRELCASAHCQCVHHAVGTGFRTCCCRSAIVLHRLSRNAEAHVHAVCILPAMKQPSRGVTLLELLVTLAVAGVLAMLAAPSLRNLVLRQSVDSAANLLVSDVRYARSEALKRSRVVMICASSTGTACTTSGAAWRNGWMVCVPSNGTSCTVGDVILRVQSAPPSVDSIGPSSGSAPPDFKFEATGMSSLANASLIVKPSGSSDVALHRLICVSKSGRAALRARGEASCS